MAGEILKHCAAGTEVGLVEGAKGIFDVAVDDKVVYSKHELELIGIGEVDEKAVCEAIDNGTLRLLDS